jgi:hypothetical protein
VASGVADAGEGLAAVALLLGGALGAPLLGEGCGYGGGPRVRCRARTDRGPPRGRPW